MIGKAAAFLLSVVVVGSVVPAGACGGSDSSTGGAGTPGSGTAGPTGVESASQEMLRSMIPGATDLPGLTLSSSGFVDNEGASAQAPDPAARLARLNEVGRVVGFHAVFQAAEGAPAGTPDVVLWSVNLFEEPAGALAFVNEPPEVPEGAALESLDVSGFRGDVVGYVLRSADPAVPGAEYAVAFAAGVVEVGVVALYFGTESSTDYILSLAEQAQSLVEGAAQGGAPPQAPLEAEPTAAAAGAVPTETPGGIQVPIRAVVGTPEP